MRVIVKIGSSIVASHEGLNEGRIQSLSADIAALSDTGCDVVIVSSGAVAAGLKKLGLKQRPKEIRLKQAAAAIGQSSLMWAYEKAFGGYGKKVAQVLLTREDISDRKRYVNSKNTLLALLEYGVIPVVNENDTVTVDEIKFGDNDRLAALVAALLGADRLVILSDVDGLYTADPGKSSSASLISTVTEITSGLKDIAGGQGSAVGTGGMYSKLLAAEMAMRSGIIVNIINGKRQGLLVSLLKGERHGTEFVPPKERLSAKKGWIAFGIRPKGSIVIDNGAKNALISKGKSLLPSGIISAGGGFETGDAVYCVDAAGVRIAKGLTNYSASEVEKIKGRKTTEIEGILGYKYSDEVIHRDNLVMLPKA
ncbi:MAG: glutamate 5-kinase [Thermodesulfovibrionales bacterium]|nr:glutamate 5-kinase [Thermodesulfovibrionales bacterium]